MIGKWEKVHYGDYPFLAKCSRCGHEIDTHYEGKHPNFCSNCGLPYYAEGDTLEDAAKRWNEFTVDDSDCMTLTAYLRSIYLERMKNEENNI